MLFSKEDRLKEYVNDVLRDRYYKSIHLPIESDIQYKKRVVCSTTSHSLFVCEEDGASM